MNTLIQFSKSLTSIPASVGWYLGDLGEAVGRQQLFTKQSPQRLKALREHALIESAVSSNRIEGVEVDQKRIGTVLFGTPSLRDRDEEEVRGYRQALDLIHAEGRKLPVSEEVIRQLHQLARGEIWDAGKYKERDGDIIERYADGRERVRFSPTSAAGTPEAMSELEPVFEGKMGAAYGGTGSIQSGFSLHPSLSRWQRTCFTASASLAVLPFGTGSRPLYQYRARDRAAQATILRDARALFARLA
jgi:hypothetical protein